MTKRPDHSTQKLQTGAKPPVRHRHGGNEKPSLRRAALARRATIAGAQAPGAAQRLADIHLPFLGGDRVEVSGYVAHGSELDPLALMRVLASAGHHLCLPVVTGPARPLLFRRWRAGDTLKDGAMKIPAPLPNAPTVTPQILLVPLLIVDRTGIRLGYGGGFYDRTLQTLRALNPANPPVAVGICYSGQIVDKVPRDVHDQPLDWILTPDFAIEIPASTANRA